MVQFGAEQIGAVSSFRRRKRSETRRPIESWMQDPTSGYGAVDESGGGVVQAELFGSPDRRVQIVGRRWTSMDFPTRMLLWPPDPVTIDSPAVEVLELPD
uniref:Uncharacterized protein n=1 Tax=Oryza nivara TaxID=4536 RepID=A0A0E0FW24_ORYNI